MSDQPRPVVDAAANQKRRGDIIGAIALVLGGVPALILLFDMDALTAAQVSGITLFLGLLTTAAMVLFARQDLKTALNVETQVTPVASPRDDEGVPFVPIALDSFED